MPKRTIKLQFVESEDGVEMLLPGKDFIPVQRFAIEDEIKQIEALDHEDESLKKQAEERVKFLKAQIELLDQVGKRLVDAIKNASDKLAERQYTLKSYTASERIAAKLEATTTPESGEKPHLDEDRYALELMRTCLVESPVKAGDLEPRVFDRLYGELLRLTEPSESEIFFTSRSRGIFETGEPSKNG